MEGAEGVKTGLGRHCEVNGVEAVEEGVEMDGVEFMFTPNKEQHTHTISMLKDPASRTA